MADFHAILRRNGLRAFVWRLPDMPVAGTGGIDNDIQLGTQAFLP
jgi:hypothetical protein